MEQNLETIIGKIIQNKLPVEWMRFNMFLFDDIYRNIPMLVFRVHEQKIDTQIEELKNCVADFQCKCEWKVFRDPLSNKGNYLLTLAIMEAIHKVYSKKRDSYNVREYLGIEIYNSYCEQAVQDIPMLAEHIGKCFSL